ncbi:hypothetical protein GCM10009546_29250 [Actinomadura livida]|uniref:Uncharacterized protein n=1 Tax=Actinomadura livida TaxID=79909 RepID=A0ABN1EGF8_9ACTN|nr:hypothetical protein GCM10010208_33930 [Actinomadura livida]
MQSCGRPSAERRTAPSNKGAPWAYTATRNKDSPGHETRAGLPLVEEVAYGPESPAGRIGTARGPEARLGSRHCPPKAILATGCCIGYYDPRFWIAVDPVTDRDRIIAATKILRFSISCSAPARRASRIWLYSPPQANYALLQGAVRVHSADGLRR